MTPKNCCLPQFWICCISNRVLQTPWTACPGRFHCLKIIVLPIWGATDQEVSLLHSNTVQIFLFGVFMFFPHAHWLSSCHTWLRSYLSIIIPSDFPPSCFLLPSSAQSMHFMCMCTPDLLLQQNYDPSCWCDGIRVIHVTCGRFLRSSWLRLPPWLLHEMSFISEQYKV